MYMASHTNDIGITALRPAAIFVVPKLLNYENSWQGVESTQKEKEKHIECTQIKK